MLISYLESCIFRTTDISSKTHLQNLTTLKVEAFCKLKTNYGIAANFILNNIQEHLSKLKTI